MKKAALLSVLSAFALATSALAQVSADVAQRVQASYLLAFGRAANGGEVTYWARQNVHSVGDLVNLHRQYLSRDAGTHRATIARAYIDAMGRNPTEAEITYWSRGTDTYSQLMKNHVSWLGGNPAEYENVIRRSYQYALGRQPTPAEIRYWKGQGTLSYAMLVACHEDWKRRNGAAAQKTSGGLAIAANVPVLATLTVSPAIANEARAASGLVSTNGGNVIAAGGGNVIAAGGGNVIAAGGGNVIAAGGGNVIAAGGGNVIAAGGGNLMPPR